MRINGLDAEAMTAAKQRWDAVAKPLGGLGEFENIIIQIAGILGTHKFTLDKRAVVVICADNGVVAEGVTQTGQEVTAAVANNFQSGKTSVCVMAEKAKADVFAVDMGVATDTVGTLNRKIARGTQNIAKGAAMTREDAKKAVETGIELVRELKEKGYKIIVTGEMGIGNTTTSAAVSSVLLGVEPEAVTGRGAGLSESGLKRKIEVIKRAIEVNKPDRNDVIDVISKVGGFDIAGLAGVFLGGAVYRVPVVIDGFISAAAALCAARLCGKCVDFMIASHVSDEPAAEMILAELGKKAVIRAGMRLGEGTGGVMLLPLLDMAFAVYGEMATFEETEIEAYKELK